MPTSLEAAVLLCCARTSLNAETRERIRELLKTGVDWERLLRTAFQHRVTPAPVPEPLGNLPGPRSLQGS